MYEITCPSCSASFEYNPDDYIHLCSYCSSGFILDIEENAKDLIGDHYIIPNKLEREEVETIFYDWVNKKYHRSDRVKSEFKVLGYYGVMLPYWVISLEAHTFWSGHSIKANEYPGQTKDYSSKF
ncbi:MAG: hypothetical protein K2X39_06280, partial [Silvanigrellaceae bacterium]|nr:hypothetical protein [Silvanigrellaceae bacterium]